MNRIIIINNLANNSTFSTVMSGVFVYVLSQMFMEYILNPIKEFRNMKKKIEYSLSMYCRYYNNPYNELKKTKKSSYEDEYKNASTEMRKIASDFSGCIGVMFILRKKTRKNLNEVLDSLIGLSNGFFIQFENDPVIKNNRELEKKIRNILNLKK